VIKLVPLIIFPLSFFLIFLGVKNLTGNFPLDKEKIDPNDKEEIVKSNQNFDVIEKKTLTKVEKNFVDVDVNSADTEETKKIPLSLEKEIGSKEINNLSAKSEKKESNSKASQKKADNILIIEEKYNYLIQFGAFSKKRNAEDLKKSVIEKVNTKFPDFLINVDFDEKKKLYKLISQTNDINKAREVCKFFKEKKINCLFKKQ
tara:strand:- start:727 stop:1335 length:609 start_codon:yes stop_codon:yes gene_type:complete